MIVRVVSGSGRGGWRFLYRGLPAKDIAIHS